MKFGEMRGSLYIFQHFSRFSMASFYPKIFGIKFRSSPFWGQITPAFTADCWRDLLLLKFASVPFADLHVQSVSMKYNAVLLLLLLDRGWVKTPVLFKSFVGQRS